MSTKDVCPINSIFGSGNKSVAANPISFYKDKWRLIKLATNAEMNMYWTFKNKDNKKTNVYSFIFILGSEFVMKFLFLFKHYLKKVKFITILI